VRLGVPRELEAGAGGKGGLVEDAEELLKYLSE
jgi:hypothetical protein